MVPHDRSTTTHPVPGSATQARDHVRSLIESAAGTPAGMSCGGDSVADALLVTSELVTNAFRHGGGLVDFSASVGPDGLRLVVADASSAVPTPLPRLPGAARPGGFGWPLVRRLARSVSVAATPQGGKRIEVLMPLGRAAGAAHGAQRAGRY